MRAATAFVNDRRMPGPSSLAHHGATVLARIEHCVEHRLMTSASRHWWRLKRSLGRRYREWRLPGSYLRLGTRYGGWWVDSGAIGSQPLLVDCGLGVDISFPVAFLGRFGGRAIGIDPNPRSVAYCEARKPQDMEIRAQAFWREAGQMLSFHLPRPLEALPDGADGVSGSLLSSHVYAGAAQIEVNTTSLAEVLATAGRSECDVLKLDIEGAEYDVLGALCADGGIRRTRQLLVEFHHDWTEHPIEHTLAAVEALQGSGFDLMHTEGRNHIFRRTGLA